MTALPPLFTRRRAGLVVRLGVAGLALAAIMACSALAARMIAGMAAAGTAQAAVATGLLVLAACALPVVRGAEQALAERLALAHVAEIRDRLLRHGFALPPRLMAGRRRTLVMLRFVGDMTALRGWVRFGVARLIVLAVALPGLALVLAAADPGLAALVAGPVVALVLILAALAPALRRRHASVRGRRARLAGEAGEALAEPATVREAGRAASVRRRVRRHGRALAEAGAARARLSFAVRSLPEATTLLTLALLALIGAIGVGAPALEPGRVVGAVVALGVLAPMLADLARALDRRCDAEVAAEAIARFLALPTVTPPATATLPPGEGPLDVVLEDVRLEPDGPALNTAIAPGEIVALEGAPGSGKSRLLACLAGLDTPAEGRIAIGSADPVALDPRARRAAVALVAAEIVPLSGTLKRALRWRAPEADESELAAVARTLGLARLIARAGGLDARLGRGGWMPSRVESGLIVLARALMRRPRLLLLDAPETLLDRASLDRLAGLLPGLGATVLIASEDRALRAVCARTLSLDRAEAIA
jgi:ABC-type multidrug transport system fused ATPase/permease subunit